VMAAFATIVQHGTRVDHVVGAYDRWLRRVPAEYRRSVLGQSGGQPPVAADDPNCLGMIKHYYSLPCARV
jgi:chromosome partitioning protein